VKRKLTKVDIGGGQSIVTVKIISDYCEPSSILSKHYQLQLLKDLTTSPELLNCGFATFEKLSMKHTGEHWEIEMFATQIE
jgi:hypothetical protein